MSAFTVAPPPEVITDPTKFQSFLDESTKQSIKPDYQAARDQSMFTIALFIGSAYFLVNHSNWVIYGFAVFFMCFALCLMRLIAIDCVRQVFTPNHLLNRVLGEIMLLPFVQPYETHQPNNRSNDRELSPELIKAHGLDDGGLYDDRQPIYESLVKKAKAGFTMSTLAVYGVQVALIAYFLFRSPVALLKNWAVPVLLYPFLHPSVFSVFTNNIDQVVADTLIENIPSYHLQRVSALIQQIQSGKAAQKARLENTPTKRASKGFFSDLRQSITETWPRLHWINIMFVLVMPMIGFAGSRYVALTTPTLAWAIFYYVFSGLGITAGYHRLFAHRAYDAHPSVLALMMIMGTSALQGSVKWWCGGHRIHHRYTDTDYDPYCAKTGFWYSHIGWMMVHPNPEYKIKADIKDLSDSPMIRWQHKNYLWFGPFWAYVFPALVAGLGWGDWAGGFIYAGIIRLFFVHHATFCVNSVAHFIGDYTFDDTRTPKDHLITAFLTFGEGYHNFHHEFPNDYRNGIRFFDYDPTKWLIKAFNLVGLTYKLRVFPSNEIEKGKAHMKEKQLMKAKAKITYPPSIDTLPLMTWAELKDAVKTGKQLTVIDGLVHDITTFIPRHPGGKAFIESSVGCDATIRFRGETGIYKHSQAAIHLLSSYRVARLHESEQEQKDRVQKEQDRLKKFSPRPMSS